jgi:hypothetical protein
MRIPEMARSREIFRPRNNSRELMEKEEGYEKDVSNRIGYHNGIRVYGLWGQ